MAYKHGLQALNALNSTFLSGGTIYSGSTDLSELIKSSGIQGVAIYDDGVQISSGNTTSFDFIGTGVTTVALSGGSRVNVYIPPFTIASHWNTTDGSTNGIVSESNLSRATKRISTPTSEGTPFYTGGWAGSNQSSTLSSSVTVAAAEQVTGFGGDSTMTITVYRGDGVAADTFVTGVITGDGVFSQNGITLTISNYESDTFRFKANASVAVDLTQYFTSGGRYYVEVSHTTDTNTDDGLTYTYTQTDVFYDTNPSTPTVGTVAIQETSGAIVSKHISGIEYYILGSDFTIDVSDINDLNENTIRTSNNVTIEAADYGLPSSNLEPFNDAGFTGWDNQFDNTGASYQRTNWEINDTNYRFRGNTANGSSTVRDAWTASDSSNSANASILVDTYTTSSTDLIEFFISENRRLESDYTTSWDSTATLVDGEAMVMGGQLQVASQGTYEGESSATNSDWSTFKPNGEGANPNPNYSTLTSAANFYRIFTDTSGLERSNFTLTFNGTSNATTALANGDIEVYVRRVNSTDPTAGTGTTANALLLHGAQYNFATFDDGATDGQIRLGSSSSNTVEGTFGGRNCVGGIYFEVKIVDTSIKISQLSISFS